MRNFIFILLIGSLLLFAFPLYADEGDWAVPIGPDERELPNTDIGLIKQIRNYYEEGSYKWALIACEAMEEKFSDSKYRPESDLIRIKSHLKLDEYEGVLKQIDDYLKDYKKTKWAINGIDLYIDLFSDMNTPYYYYNWRQYLYDQYELDYYSKDFSDLDKKRREILRKAEDIYNYFKDRATDEKSRLEYADSLVYKYVLMYNYFDWYDEDAEKPAIDEYNKRIEYLKGLLDYEMSINMRSALECLIFCENVNRYATDYSLYEKYVAEGGKLNYDIWLLHTKYDKFSPILQEITDKYEGTPGAMLAKSLQYHYLITMENDPLNALEYMQMVYDIMPDSWAKVELLKTMEEMKRPAMGILSFSNSTLSSPQINIDFGCKSHKEITLKLYSCDVFKYFEVDEQMGGTVKKDKIKTDKYDRLELPESLSPDDLKKYGDSIDPIKIYPYKAVSVGEIEGVEGMVDEWKVDTGCNDEYHIEKVSYSIDTLEPGLYILEARAGDDVSTVLFLHTNAALISANDNLTKFAFKVVDLENGENCKISDFILYHRWWDYDEDGYWTDFSETIKNPEYDRLGDSYFFDFKKMKKSHYYDLIVISDEGPALYQLYTPYQDPVDTTSTSVVYTDRPLYKPEQKVSYKAILREVDYLEKILYPMKNKEVEAILYAPDGEEIKRETLETNEFGSVSGEFQLPEGGMLGQHYIDIQWKYNEQNYNGYTYFSVEEFEKPEYEVFSYPEKDRYLSGEKVRLVVEGRYYFGQPMSGSKVDYTVYRYGYTPDGEYDSYKKVDDGVGYMDKEGKYIIEFATPYAGKVNNSFNIEIDVEDPSHRLIETTGYIYTYRNDQYVSVSLDKYSYQAGDSIDITFNVYDWYSKPVSFKKVKYEIHKQKYNQQNYTYEKVEKVYEGEAITDDEGKVKQVHELNLNEGEYLVEASIEDSQGTGVTTSTTFSVVAKQEEVVERLPEFDIQYNYPEKGYFDLYDDVEITLVSRFDEVDATLYFSANGLMETRTMDLKSADRGSKTSFVISLDPKYLPNLNIYGHIVYDGRRYSDNAGIYFNNTDTDLNVEITPEKSEYQPGDSAVIDVKIEDHYGNPVDCEFSLSALDESLLALAYDNTVNLVSTFDYSLERYSWVYLYDSLYNMGLIRQILYIFPYYPKYSASSASSFIPLFHSWGSTEDVLGKLSIPYLYKNKELYSLISLSGNNRLGAYYTTQEKIEEAGYTKDYLTSIVYGLTEQTVKVDEFDGLGGGGGAGGLGSGEMEEESITYSEKDKTLSKSVEEPMERKMEDISAFDDEYAPAPVSGEVSFNGGMIQFEGKEFKIAELRKEFKDSAFWNPVITTGADGLAEVEIKLPDNLTTWKVIGLAIDEGQRIGYMDNLFEVKKNIIARLKAPRFLVAGDKSLIKLIAHNYLEVDKEFLLSIENEGLTILEGDDKKTIEIKAGELDTLSQWITTDKTGDALIISSALTDVESDASQTLLPVFPHGAMLKQAWAGRLRDVIEHTLTVPEKIDPATFHSELILSPSLAASLSHGLDFFKEYPYECVEQTLNRFYPNTVMADAASKLGLDESILSEGLEESITEGIIRLEETQTDKGGWPWWKGGEASPYITAYVVDALYNLRENSFVKGENKEKVERLYNDAVSYLLKYIEEFKEKRDYFSFELSLYIADLMLRTGLDNEHRDIIRDSAYYYFKNREHRSDRALVLLASVMHQLGEKSKVQVLLRNLDNNAQVDTDKTLYWGRKPEESWRWWDDSVETTSKVLEIKMRVEPDSLQIPYIVDWLVDQRRGAQWKSTKDSSVATTALIHYILNYPEVQEPIITGYVLNDEKVGGIELDPTNYESPSESAVFDLSDFQTGDNILRVERESGEGPVFYTMVSEFYTEADFIPAVEGSVQIDREYFIIKKKFKDGELIEERLPLDRPLEIGEELEVQLSINSPYAFDYVVVEDPRPAGCVNIEMKSYYDWWTGAYIQLWNQKRSIMFDRLPKGETVFSYRLRAEVPGEFSALPATVFGMYSPDIGSSTDEAKIEVVEE